MIVTLTRPEAKTAIDNQYRGPLRRLVDDVTNLNRRLGVVENRVLRERDRAISSDKYNNTPKTFGQVESRLYPNEVWDREQHIRMLNQSTKGLVNK